MTPVDGVTSHGSNRSSHRETGQGKSEEKVRTETSKYHCNKSTEKAPVAVSGRA